MRTMLVLTHNSDDEELAHEQNEVGDLVHHSEADDVAQDETERRECRHAEVLAVDGTLQQAGVNGLIVKIHQQVPA